MILRMTPDQRKFAEDHHGLFLKFLSEYRLDDEFYSVLIERYLKTVIKYSVNRKLQRYAFSTVLWQNLRSELNNYWEKSVRMPVIYSTDDCYMLPGDGDIPIDHEFLEQLEETLTKKQHETILLRDQGFSNREIAEICGVTEKAIEKRFHRIRKILKRRTEQ